LERKTVSKFRNETADYTDYADTDKMILT
jgi:hypothetical protein